MIAGTPDLALLVNLLQLAVKDRTQLALENIALHTARRMRRERVDNRERPREN